MTRFMNEPIYEGSAQAVDEYTQQSKKIAEESMELFRLISDTDEVTQDNLEFLRKLREMLRQGISKEDIKIILTPNMSLERFKVLAVLLALGYENDVMEWLAHDVADDVLADTASMAATGISLDECKEWYAKRIKEMGSILNSREEGSQVAEHFTHYFSDM